MSEPTPAPAPPAPRPPAGAPRASAPGAALRPSRLRERVRRRGGRGAAMGFLLANAIPAGAAVWFFTRPQAERDRFLSAIPAGAGTRAATAGIAFGVLVVLALVVLPGARAVISALARAQAWFRTRPTALRVVLFPAEAIVGLLWFVAQCLFAVDAVLILASAAAFLVYTARILKPDLFPTLPY